MCTDVSCFRPGNACIRKAHACIRKATCLYPKSYVFSNSRQICPQVLVSEKQLPVSEKQLPVSEKHNPNPSPFVPHLFPGFLAALNPQPPSVLSKPPRMTTNGVMSMDYVNARTRVLQQYGTMPSVNHQAQEEVSNPSSLPLQSMHHS